MQDYISTFFSDYQVALDLLVTNGVNFSLRIVLAIFIFFIGKRLAKWITNMMIRALRKSNADEELVGFVESLAYWALFSAVIIAALGQLGVETASFLAIIGAAGLAIGLALQGSLSNFAAGVLILILRPFNMGDFVEIAGESGTVKRIRIFTTELRTPDNKCVIIPNSRVLDSNIVNYTSTGRRRVDMTFSVDYADDITTVKEILYRLVKADERVLADEKPVIALHELADSSINFVVRPWVKSDDYWPFYWEMNEKIKAEFDAAGISIPFPQQVVHKKS